jgi:hypothetical protein
MVMLLHLLYGKPSKEFNEIYRDEYIKDMLAQCKKFGTTVENRMLVVPAPFQTECKKDVAAYKVVLDEKDYDGSSLVAIHLSFQKLLVSLRQPLQRMKLQKEQTLHNDILDSFLLSLQFYKRVK